MPLCCESFCIHGSLQKFSWIRLEILYNSITICLMCAIVTCVHSSHLSTTRLATRPISFALCCAVKPETRADIEVARLALPRKRCGLGLR
ncbi:hypothetical protein HBI75_229200 [Parastagonospora nodorum]|nr:hypothetical protein HBI06_243220 [Parastagonospora nodorum]KAH4224500.1 hypothetical protein HBI05_235480 [Parastagonospora nodorum]KAH5005150.1 hypothetical protein HBI75_229200 [Parastagonospora nodorum]KAH5585440.1 hypothetical protein HBI45_239310 [Parastagonospora nodorum]KAH6355656.1 hypothetical protein HBI34_225560 [Parastagonospora nodorum]